MTSKSNSVNFPDGLDALCVELSVSDIARLIERTARWVAPETFQSLPLWYPEHARGQHFFKANWTEPQPNTKRGTDVSVHKVEGNTHANKALTMALGLRPKERPNWSCCHIWGIDDPGFQQANHFITDARYFSCVANMVLLPTPLKAFTDVMPEIKSMLRVCASHLYGWQPDKVDQQPAHGALQQLFVAGDYPVSWPTDRKACTPLGLIPLNDRIRDGIARRKLAIKTDMEQAGSFYPRMQVQTVLNYWGIAL